MAPHFKLARLIAALAALLLAAVAVEAAGLGLQSIGLGRRLAAGAAGLGALAATGLAVGPSRWWWLMNACSARLSAAFQAPNENQPSSAGTVLIIVGFVTYLASIGIALPRQTDPWDDDQGAYLQTASEIHESGGPVSLVGSLFRGEFAEANRHPLYLGLLSLRPTFEAGKFFSACIGVAGLAAMTWLLARQRGMLVAGVFSVLLATNAAFVVFTTRVVCDGLLVVFPGLLWLLARRRTSDMTPGVAQFSDQRVHPSPKHKRGNQNPAQPIPSLALRASVMFQKNVPCAASRNVQAGLLVGIGVLLGLSYLSKGTGLLLFGCTVLWFGVSPFCSRGSRRDALINAIRNIAVTGVAFAVVASPLLVRNIRRFGNPFYNVNSLLLFADKYEEFDALIAQGVSTGEAADRYFDTHTFGDMARRETSGLVWELFIMLRSLGPAPLDDSRILFGIPIVGLAMAVAWAQRRWEHGLLLVWCLGFWVVFAWYVPIAAGERFILPILAPVLVLAAEGILRLAPQQRAGAVLWAGGLWSIAWLAFTYLSQWPG